MIEARENRCFKQSWRHRPALTAVILYLLTLTIRLPGIATAPLQSDEQHWLSRSARVVTRLHNAPLHATTHLGHPGIVPAIVMATGQVVGRRWNQITNATFGTQWWFVDSYTASRLAACMVASLIVPLLFLICVGEVGWVGALVVALLIACDPNHIRLSRYAHLDAVLALLVVGTVAAYTRAISTGKLGWKLFSGVLWGLCIATKPTAVALVPAFIIAKICLPRGRRAERIVEWSDIYAVFIGHLTLALIFTRLWLHQSDYLIRLHVKSAIADRLYAIGTWGSDHALLATCAIVFIGVLASIARRRGYRQISTALYVGASLVLSLVVFPQVWENLARFWGWVFGLSGEGHKAFGKSFAAPPGGYPGLLLTMLPPLALLGALGGVFLWGRRRTLPPTVVCVGVVAFSVWMAMLSVSSKQAFRYLLPIVPFVMMLAATFWSAALQWLYAQRRPVLARISAVCIVAIQIAAPLSVAPWYDGYLNPWVREQGPYLDRGIIRPLAGRGELLHLLVQASRDTHARQLVTVIGDTEALRYDLDRRLQNADRAVIFGYFPPRQADYVVVDRFMREVAPEWIRTLRNPVWEQLYGDGALTALYRVDPTPLQEPYSLMGGTAGRQVGALRVLRDKRKALVAQRGKDSQGNLVLHPYGVRLVAGRYEVSVELDLRREKERKDGGAAAVWMKMWQGCERRVSTDELAIEEARQIRFSCELSDARRVYPEMYWFGDASVRVFQFQVTSSSQER